MVNPNLLRNTKLFADLSDKDLAEVATIAWLENLKADSEVFGENEVATTVYVVAGGKAAVKMKSRKGQEVIVDELGPGELFGWSAVLEDQTFTAAVQTVEDSTLVAFDGAMLRRLFEQNHRIGCRVLLNIAAVVSSRLAHLRAKLVDEPFAPEWLTSPTSAVSTGPAMVGATSEMRSMDCPSCGTKNGPYAVMNDTEQYRCRNCGMVYYSPAGCET
jgi:CRP/FNR family transcriptional regulator, cyclic AMP receptor protein